MLNYGNGDYHPPRIRDKGVARKMDFSASGHERRRVPEAAGVSVPVELGTEEHVLVMPEKRRPHRTGGNRDRWTGSAA